MLKISDELNELAKIVLLITLPDCLDPILTDNTPNSGASITPLDELPITQDEFRISDR